MNQSKMLMQISLITAVIFSIALSPLVASTPAIDEDDKVLKVRNDGPLYTAYNIWYEVGKQNSLWCINYKKGEMIPAGTEVTDVRLVKAESGRFLGGSEIAISFTTVEDGEEYLVNFKPVFHPDLDIDDYMDKMFSEKDFAQLTEGMNEYEIEAIQKGKVKVKMSKAAILVSYGYPPEHRTPKLEKEMWLYWINRFQTKAIHFDENELTHRPTADPDEL